MFCPFSFVSEPLACGLTSSPLPPSQLNSDATSRAPRLDEMSCDKELFGERISSGRNFFGHRDKHESTNLTDSALRRAGLFAGRWVEGKTLKPSEPDAVSERSRMRRCRRPCPLFIRAGGSELLRNIFGRQKRRRFSLAPGKLRHRRGQFSKTAWALSGACRSR